MNAAEQPATPYNKSLILWLVVYGCCVLGITLALWQIRRTTIEQYTTPEAIEDWQDWREEVAKQTTGKGPVQRRSIESSEAPIVRLMRDYFWTSWLAMLLMFSMVFATFAFLLSGAFATRRTNTSQHEKPE